MTEKACRAKIWFSSRFELGMRTQCTSRVSLMEVNVRATVTTARTLASYFVINPDTAFPFMQLNATGLNTAITYTPPKKDSQNQGTPTPNPAVSPANLLENLNASPQVKRTFSMQAVQ